MTNLLRRMEAVELRSVWTSESGDFTPWLAKEENLALLGETIGLELELEAQEKDVGPFRADVLCKDTATGHWVLIENQLERTDHAHLGQLLTYAAGLKAVTIVWLAGKFTEEHRAAIDWLNEITDDRFNFFGLEIELWRIGDSPMAPKFNAVCRPNEWTKPPPPPPTETGQLYLEYWTALRSHLESAGTSIRMQKPQPWGWMTYAVGRTGFYLATVISKTKRRLTVEQVIQGADHVAYFEMLAAQKSEIERELGESLVWRELPDGKESQIRRDFDNTDPAHRADWPRQHQLIRDWLERLHGAFSKRVKELDLADYEADSVAVDTGLAGSDGRPD